MRISQTINAQQEGYKTAANDKSYYRRHGPLNPLEPANSDMSGSVCTYIYDLSQPGREFRETAGEKCR
jgi:hypothetical protein